MTFDDTLATLHESLLANGVPKDTAAKVIKDLQRAAQQEKATRTPAKRNRKETAILVTDPDGRLAGMSLVGFVIQMEQDAPPQAAYHRLVAAADRFNGTVKGRKIPVKTVGEACEALRGKALQQERADQKLSIMTRVPVVIQAVPNALPSDKANDRADQAAA